MTRSGLSYAQGMTDEEKAAQAKATRTSTGAFVTAGEDKTGLVNRLEDRIANVLMLERSSFEAWNVLHYDIDQHYYGHHDYFDPDIFPQYKQNPGLQRKYTLLMYLNDVEDGGETNFPWESRDRGGDPDFSYEVCEFGVKVRANKGDAIYFESLSPDHTLDIRSLHAGCPVLKGSKWVATKVRYGPPAHSCARSMFFDAKRRPDLVNALVSSPFIAGRSGLSLDTIRRGDWGTDGVATSWRRCRSIYCNDTLGRPRKKMMRSRISLARQCERVTLRHQGVASIKLTADDASSRVDVPYTVRFQRIVNHDS